MDQVNSTSAVPAALRASGEMAISEGRWPDAQVAFEQVVRCQPADMTARVKLAIALARQKHLDPAIACLRETIRLDPQFSQAHHNLAVALAEQGKLAVAVESFREALRLSPQYVEAHLNLANALASLNRRDEAVEHYRRACELRPESAEALNGLGSTLTELGRPAEAAVYLQQAVRLRPDFAEAWNSLGLALAEEADFTAAQAAYEQALRLNPRYVEAHTNFASSYSHQGKLAKALAGYDVALWLNPQQVSTRWNRSLALLQSGDLEQGFREYEWRWRRPKSLMRPMPRPMWDGSDPAGKTLLLWAEQGLGDAIQFVRYAKLLKERGATVLLECPQPLSKVLGTCPGVDRLLQECDALEGFDAHCPLMSLPRLFGTTLANVPNPVPYVIPGEQSVQRWRQEFACTPGLRVGIVWQGNPHHQWDRYRSVPLKCFAALASVQGIQLISLQTGPGADQLTSFPGTPHVRRIAQLHSSNSQATLWAEMAGLVKCLDLVITVDTATAHLAGALGVRVWVVLSALCDWRWLSARTDSPWYPTMRLFRQVKLGDWDSVFGSILAALNVLVTNAP